MPIKSTALEYLRGVEAGFTNLRLLLPILQWLLSQSNEQASTNQQKYQTTK